MHCLWHPSGLAFVGRYLLTCGVNMGMVQARWEIGEAQSAGVTRQKVLSGCVGGPAEYSEVVP